MITWNVPVEVQVSADEVYSKMQLPKLETFSEFAGKLASNEIALTSDLRNTYFESLDNLILLMEESVFMTAIGWAYLIDMREILESHANNQPPIAIDGLVGGLLAGYVNYQTLPSRLFSNPEYKMAKNRIVGPWFAGNLIDSAIIRQFSALDRLISIMFIALDIDFGKNKNTGEVKFPSFSSPSLEKIYNKLSEAEKKILVSIVEDNEVFNAKEYRDRLIHRRRVDNQLSGKYFVKSSVDAPELSRGIAADEQGFFPVFLHVDVLIPATDFVSKLLRNRFLNGS